MNVVPMALRRAGRRHRRVRIPADSQLRCSFAGYQGMVTVLSEGGMFVDTVVSVPDGTEFDVTIDGIPPLRARCITRDHKPGWGLGVEFVGMQPRAMAALRELLARYS
jgi:hypothetical protein